MGLTYLPGLFVLLVGATLAQMVAPALPGVDELLIAIAFGVLLTNTVSLPDWTRPGVQTHKIWLGAGIVLMGASLALDSIVESGLVIVSSVIAVTAFSILYVELLSRAVFGTEDRLGSLLAAGSSICGVSAVVAVGGSIEANEEHIAYAAATILLFDAITLVIYPIIGRFLELSAQSFGMWAGLSMFSTGPVIAVGLEHSATAGQWATVTKLTRNALIGLVAVLYAVYYARRRTSKTSGGWGIRWQELWEQFPKFVLGFVVLAVAASLGAFSVEQVRSIETVYGWLFLLAFVGLGTDLETQKLRTTGIRPVAVVFVAFVTISVLSLFALHLLLD